VVQEALEAADEVEILVVVAYPSGTCLLSDDL